MPENKEINRLIAERDQIIRKYDNMIRQELEKERAQRKFDWKYFSYTVLASMAMVASFEINALIFPETSIWSWSYYF